MRRFLFHGNCQKSEFFASDRVLSGTGKVEAPLKFQKIFKSAKDTVVKRLILRQYQKIPKIIRIRIEIHSWKVFCSKNFCRKKFHNAEKGSFRLANSFFKPRIFRTVEGHILIKFFFQKKSHSAETFRWYFPQVLRNLASVPQN